RTSTSPPHTLIHIQVACRHSLRLVFSTHVVKCQICHGGPQGGVVQRPRHVRRQGGGVAHFTEQPAALAQYFRQAAGIGGHHRNAVEEGVQASPAQRFLARRHDEHVHHSV